MLSKLVKMVKSFIFVILGVPVQEVVNPAESVEAWQFSWFISSEELEDRRNRDKIARRIYAEKDKELEKTFADVELFMSGQGERDVERRRREFKEWMENCDMLWKRTAS